ARRDGASMRTIDRHFPTRDDLIDELSRRVSSVMGLRESPRTRDGVVATVRATFATFDQHAPLVAAQIQAGLGGKLRVRGRHKRVSHVEAMFAAAMPNL